MVPRRQAQNDSTNRKPYQAPLLSKQQNLKEITLFTDFAPPS